MTPSTGTTTTTKASKRKPKRKVVPAAAIPASNQSFPRWVIVGFVLAGVLIISGLAGFVYTRSKPR
jgi:hypothetical protein